MQKFEQHFRVTNQTSILDVGGSASIWQLTTVHPQITLFNLPSALSPANTHTAQVAGDGRWLPFRDAAFDIAFSNSVIEHVGTLQDQQEFAREIRRVADGYWVQTPDRRSPIEMHLMLPLIHLLPKRVQRAVVERFTVWEFLVRPSAEERRFYLDHFLYELRLLDRESFRLLFPDAEILQERVLGVPKSLIALRLPRREVQAGK